MSASDEFPRGLWQSGSVGTGATPSVSFPALGGNVRWVLAEIHATLLAFEQNTQYDIAVNGSFAFLHGLLVTDITSNGGSASWDWTGQITYPSGVTVQFAQALVASSAAVLNVYCYPI